MLGFRSKIRTSGLVSLATYIIAMMYGVGFILRRMVEEMGRSRTYRGWKVVGQEIADNTLGKSLLRYISLIGQLIC